MIQKGDKIQIMDKTENVYIVPSGIVQQIERDIIDQSEEVKVGGIWYNDDEYQIILLQTAKEIKKLKGLKNNKNVKVKSYKRSR